MELSTAERKLSSELYCLDEDCDWALAVGTEDVMVEVIVLAVEKEGARRSSRREEDKWINILRIHGRESKVEIYLSTRKIRDNIL